MKTILCLLFALPSLALAASPFDGTWVWDIASTKLPGKPDVYVLDKGNYDCSSCVPPLHAKADGTDQPRAGSAYSDTLAVQVVDAHTVKITYKKAGKVTGVDSLSISADGNSMTEAYEDRTESAPSTSSTMSTRIGKATAGAHALTGSWRATKVESASDNASTVVIKATADGISLKDLNGVGYDAKFDGKEYPISGDIGHTMVTLKRIDARSIEETDTRDGKVEVVFRMTVAMDGKTIHYVIEDRRHGTTTRVTLNKKM